MDQSDCYMYDCKNELTDENLVGCGECDAFLCSVMCDNEHWWLVHDVWADWEDEEGLEW